MLGYKFEDIQKMGGALHNAIEVYSTLKLDKEVLEGLLEIHNFFEGLLVEGYIEDGEVA
jgi:hypothetical protein